MGLLYDPVFLEHRTPPGHPESPRRLLSVMEGLAASGLADLVDRLPVAPAPAGAVEAVHDRGYLERIAEPGERWLDPDTYRSGSSWEAAVAAAGAVCAAVDACRAGAVRRAFCAVRPPGHHAARGRAMGFCLINNVAVATRHAQSRGYRRVMVADFDVHHGNGTQEIFYEDGTVYYFSTHQGGHYPGTGAASERGAGEGTGCNRNVPLPAGAGDRELLAAWGELFPSDLERFGPDICLVSAGYDLHAADPLAGLAATDAGIRELVRAVLRACGPIPVVATLEGGYHHPALARGVCATVEALLE